MVSNTTTIRIKKSTKKRLALASRLYTADIFIQALLNSWDEADVYQRQAAFDEIRQRRQRLEAQAAAKVREDAPLDPVDQEASELNRAGYDPGYGYDPGGGGP